MSDKPRTIRWVLRIAEALLLLTGTRAEAQCTQTVFANVVAFDQPLMFNRLGAQDINGMVYALRRDLINLDTRLPLTAGGAATPGHVAIRPDKHPRPVVLRVAAGSCLQVSFQNLLTPAANPRQPPLLFNNEPFNLAIDDQVADRFAGFHPSGLELVNSINSDSSFTGTNINSLVRAGGTGVFTFLAPHEGAFLVSSYGATFGGEGSTGQSSSGLFGAVNVEPVGARFFRSQVTEEELRLATINHTAAGQPIINYNATYPNDCPNGVWCKEGKAGLPVLAILNGTEIVHADISAIIAGPNPDGTFPPSTYPLESVGKRNPSVPNRLEAFREFTVVFHDENTVAQAFPGFYEDPVLKHTLHSVRDAFMINYGSGGIGTEILANRLRVGPMHDCLDCAFEEFFLSSWTVSDPAMVVDVPANIGLENCGPARGAACAKVGPKANKAFYPDDPSNVHHSYQNDFVKFRNTHSGAEHHMFHLHNHQWLFDANDDDSNYLDVQAIGSSSGYTYEIAFGGSGNRNKTAGDAIFHCHFYPHFAQGMWELWRNHDVLETGTVLAVSGGGFHTTPFALQDGTPAVDPANNLRVRALPDGEIAVGTPIPALVPLPGKAMPVVPGRVNIKPRVVNGHPVGSVAVINRADTSADFVDADFNRTGLRNPGYPFWIAGIEHTVGQRSTTPVLDMLPDGANPQNGGWDGGLPRHTLDGFAAGGVAVSVETRLSFEKELKKAKAVFFPETGTDVERAAMAFHSVRARVSTANLIPSGTVAAKYITNGAPPQPGAPFFEPCIDDAGVLLKAGVTGHFFDGNGGLGITGSSVFNVDHPRVYKAAAFQYDAVFNKVAWHLPQERILALWQDVVPTIQKQRGGEPMVLRNDTFDCTKYLHVNLVPKIYELDDFQVRTPTDVIGQHIHVPKWDLPSSDGSANGWNYEDGTLSPGTVQERIDAINAFNPSGAGNPPDAAGRAVNTPLRPEPHPFFGRFGRADWLGARTTIQRWFFDPIVNVPGVDRGLGVIFTHDHMSPSTHQEVGLYATVLAEPAASTWVHNETGVPFYTRDDGGPTSWEAAVLTGDIDGDGQNDSYREFYFEPGDFNNAYEAGVYVGANQQGMTANPANATSFRAAINPPFRQVAVPVFPDLILIPPNCPGGVPRPCPEAIDADDVGTFVVNYRNEPIGLRVFDPNAIGPDGKPGTQAAGEPGSLAYAYQSRTDRAIAFLNVQPLPGSNINGTIFPPPVNTGGLGPGDPYTPMPRAYYGDRVRVKMNIGSHEETHLFTIHGLKWLQGGSGFGFSPNSGWRNAQGTGIAEQFTFAAPVIPLLNGGIQADHLYSADASQDGLWNGVWGVMRFYRDDQADLIRLPNNGQAVTIANRADFTGVCPNTSPQRAHDITAVQANDVLANALGVVIVPPDDSATQHEGGPLDPAGGTLVYNPRPTALSNHKSGPLHDPTGMLYVRTNDLVPVNAADPACADPTALACDLKLRAGAPVEPVVLRAAAGECVNVTLRNHLRNPAPDLAGFTSLPPIVHRDDGSAQGVTTFNNNLIRPPSMVGLHPQLVSYDVLRGDGTLVGANPPGLPLVARGNAKVFQWYAGDISLAPTATAGSFNAVATPVEFGGSNLTPADKIKQGQKGLVGTLVIEPVNSTWVQTDRVLDHQVNSSVATRETRASATVNGLFRDFSVVFQRAVNQRYKDGTAVESIKSEEADAGDSPEDSEDSGQSALNYGSEPMWFRFGLAPNSELGNVPGGLGAVPNAHVAYSNGLVGGDPVTPVFTVTHLQEFRIHPVEPTGNARAGAFNLHGHDWQRAPYVCPGSAFLGLPGNCRPTGWFPTLTGTGGQFEVASRAIGENPTSFYLGGQESISPADHFDLVMDHAGGTAGINGDYLYRDHAGLGNLEGLWGIVRVR